MGCSRARLARDESLAFGTAWNLCLPQDKVVHPRAIGKSDTKLEFSIVQAFSPTER
jgi:hypothetical protein